jgi:hypothetical protein
MQRPRKISILKFSIQGDIFVLFLLVWHGMTQVLLNRKFRVATEIEEHIFWLLVSYRAAEKIKYDFFIISMKFPIDRIPSCPILKFWDLGRIMAVGQNRLKIVILEYFFYHHYEISEQ